MNLGVIAGVRSQTVNRVLPFDQQVRSNKIHWIGHNNITGGFEIVQKVNNFYYHTVYTTTILFPSSIVCYDKKDSAIIFVASILIHGEPYIKNKTKYVKYLVIIDYNSFIKEKIIEESSYAYILKN